MLSYNKSKNIDIDDIDIPTVLLSYTVLWTHYTVYSMNC